MEFRIAEIGQAVERVLEYAENRKSESHATLITFSGDLGAGKTTLIQTIAKKLGVSEPTQSPTFVIYKKYEIDRYGWKHFVHGDMYRLESGEEIKKLGWEELLTDPSNFICIEWPEKISEVIPEWATRVKLTHKEDDLRSIDIS